MRVCKPTQLLKPVWSCSLSCNHGIPALLTVSFSLYLKKCFVFFFFKFLRRCIFQEWLATKERTPYLIVKPVCPSLHRPSVLCKGIADRPECSSNEPV